MFNCIQQVSFSVGKLNILSSNLAHISMGEFHKDQHVGKMRGQLFSNSDGKYCGTRLPGADPTTIVLI